MLPADIDPYIASLRWPVWGAYVVAQIVQRFGLTRPQAVQAWDDHRKRKGIP